MKMRVESIELSSVKVGSRVRGSNLEPKNAAKRNAADNRLIESLGQIGQLQPIAVDQDMNLIFGARRIKCAFALGWTEIKAVVLDTSLDDVTRLLCEQDENNARMDFTPSEKKAIADRIKETLRGRKGSNQHSQKGASGNVSGPSDKGDTRDLAAAAVGVSGKTLDKIDKVVESGQQDVIQKMDSGELSINAAHKEVKARAEKSAPTHKPEKPKQKPKSKGTIVITLRREVALDSREILDGCGADYGLKLAIELLEQLGHPYEVK